MKEVEEIINLIDSYLPLLKQQYVMRMPDIITKVIANHKIIGIKKSETVESYLQMAGVLSLLIETSGQYAELLIRKTDKNITKELLLASVQDFKVIQEYQGNDLIIDVSLESHFGKIYKSFVKVLSNDMIIATGYLIHINNE